MIQTIHRTKTYAFLPPKHQSLFKQFYCACGTPLPTKDQYKDHVDKHHDGKFVEGSSHFISIFSQIVLPCRCWTPDMIGKPLPTQRVKMHQPIKEGNKNDRVIPSQREISKTEGKPKKTERAKKNNSRERGDQKLLAKQRSQSEAKKGKSSEEPKQQSAEEQKKVGDSEEKGINWNGLLLLPNASRQGAKFFCGACGLSYQSPDQFVPHCFDVCGQLDHPHSSHCITLPDNQPEQEIPELQIFQDNQVKEDENEMKGRLKNQPRHYRKKLQVREIPDHLKGIYSLFARSYKQQKVDEAGQTFRCGCGKQFQLSSQKRQISSHVILSHQEVLPHNCTHILVRIGIRNNFLKVGEDDQGGWSCPCRPGINMSLKVFVDHVRHIHKGISLKYDPTLFYNQQ